MSAMARVASTPHPRAPASLLLVVLLYLASISHGFVPVPLSQYRVAHDRCTVPTLFAGKKKTLKKSNDKKPKTAKSLHEKETTRASQRSSSSSGSPSVVLLPGVKSRAPPWQVLSAKDAKLNVEREMKRRERARESLPPLEHVVGQWQQQSKSKALLSDVDQALIKWKRFHPSSTPLCGVKFIGSYLEERLPPRLGVPEVAFLGRSNVGKSSLLNRLSASASTSTSSDQARVGKTPGATASVNLYALLKANNAHHDVTTTKPILGLVDLPGFGHARLSKRVQESVQLAAERYLDRRDELALGILLVDARREPTEDDRAVLAALYDIGVPLVVVATKVDKLNKAQLEPSLERIRQGLGLPNGQPLCVSSVTGEGTKELWTIILEACEARVEELRDKFGRPNKKVEDEEESETDDEGNPLLLEDGDDVAYDQGFDWVHDNPVMYDGDDVDFIYDDEEIGQEDYLYKDDEGEEIEGVTISDKNAFQLKHLKQRIREMKRRGDAI